MPAMVKMLGGSLVLLTALPLAMVQAGEPSTIDFSPIPKFATPEAHKTAPDQAGAAPSTSDPVGASVLKGFDSPSAKPKWYEPARIEEVPNGSDEATGSKLYLITTPLPAPMCVRDKRDASRKQVAPLCESLKF